MAWTVGNVRVWLRWSVWARLALVCVPLLMGCWAGAQTFSASITGTVEDPAGETVGGAKVTLTNSETKDQRTKVTGEHGSYDFQNLLPGTYQISVAAPGFKDYLKTGLVLRANTAANVNASLQIGSASEQVVVSADTVLVDTETPNNSITMDQVLIANLPNSTRNPLNFVYDLAGTTESQGGMTSRSQTFDQLASTFGINGGRSAESEILIDGAPSTAIDWGGLMVSPIQDSVQEQQVVQNEYDAQYHGGGEGVVTLITKNGSDRFHWEAYDYFRNDALDANTWTNKHPLNPGDPITPRQKFHRNQFGGNFSGPLWRSKHLFFFGAYEGLRQPGPLGRTYYTVPTALERQGDFSQTYLSSGALDVIYNPFTTRAITNPDGSVSYTRDPYPGNKIPGGLDPVGQKIANLYPLPNSAGQGPQRSNNYVVSPSNNTGNDKFDVRVDWAQNEKHRIFGRVSDRFRENQSPSCVFCNGADTNTGNYDHAIQVSLNDTVTPTSRWVIDTFGAYSRWFESQHAVDYGKYSPSAIGLDPGISQATSLPEVGVGQYSGLGAGFDRYVRYSSTASINFTRELSAHSLKFGFNYDIGMINIRNDASASFNFDNFQTSCYSPGDGTQCTVDPNNSINGNPLASLLVGVGSGGGSTFNLDPAMSQHSFGLYLQDNWRATRNLTVYAGLRYENQRPATERHNRVAYFDPNLVNSLSTAYGSTVRGGFEYAGVDGRGRNEWQPDNLNFSPRVGIAYKISPSAVFRAGSGMFYAPTSAMLGYDGNGQSPGYTGQTTWVPTQFNQGYVPNNLVSNPFPGGLAPITGNSAGDQTLIGIGAGQIWLKGPHPVGVLYQWSTDFQFQVSAHAVFEIGYTGVRGRRLLYGNPNLDIDQLPTADLALGDSLNDQVANPFYGVITDPNSFLSGPLISRNTLLRHYPAFGYLQLTRSTPGARSQFDALNVKFNHSFSSGLSSITTYRWSKDLDNGSEARIGWTGVDNWRDATNTKLDYSYSTHDIPQSFAEALVYQLPYGPGRRWGGGAPQILRQTLGGWNTSTSIRLSSGLVLANPVNFGPYNNPLGNYGFPGVGLPDLVGNPKPAHRSMSHWINPGAFEGLAENGVGNQNCSETVDYGDGNGPQVCQPFRYKYGNMPAHLNSLREAANNNVDLGLAKQFGTDRYTTEFRADFLNLFNHPIYGGGGYGYPNIDTNLQNNTFGQVIGVRNDPRNIQLSLKISY